MSNQGLEMQLDRQAGYCRKTALGLNESKVKQKKKRNKRSTQP